MFKPNACGSMGKFYFSENVKIELRKGQDCMASYLTLWVCELISELGWIWCLIEIPTLGGKMTKLWHLCSYLIPVPFIPTWDFVCNRPSLSPHLQILSLKKVESNFFFLFINKEFCFFFFFWILFLFLYKQANPIFKFQSLKKVESNLFFLFINK